MSPEVQHEWLPGEECRPSLALMWGVRKKPRLMIHKGVIEGENFLMLCGRWMARTDVVAIPAGNAPGMRPANGTLCGRCWRW